MKILLVDDERGFLDVMGDILRENHNHVTIAENGKQARESLEIEQFDLIISDIFMPTLDGLRFHDYVREFTTVQDIPFIFMSGYDDEHTRRVVLDPSIDFFLSKTAPIENLLELVETLRTAKESKTE